GLTSSSGHAQTDTANVIPELAGGWNDGLACFIFRFLKRPQNSLKIHILQNTLIIPICPMIIEVVCIAGRLNAKNSYGAYIGDRLFAVVFIDTK
ncbi:hypothetical protein CJ307_34205, partial [Klebsiella quasipneumoniae]